MRINWSLGAIGLLLAAALTGCGGEKTASPAAVTHRPYENGTFTARSSPDDAGAIGEITVVVAGGKIVRAEYKGIEKNGRVKDGDYGKTSGRIENRDFYRKAQHAVRAAESYADKLVEAQRIEAVDAVAGATVSHRQFTEAVRKALNREGPVDAEAGASIHIQRWLANWLQSVF